MHLTHTDILLIYAAKPSGHQTAANAIHDSLRHISPELKVTELDFFTKGYPILGPTIASLYLEVVQKTPNFWSYLYKNNDIEGISRELRKLFNSLQLPKMRYYLQKYKPSVVISTHAATSGILAWEKEKNKNSNFLLACVITDFGLNNYWPLKYNDIYFVASDEVKRELLLKGVPSKRIEVTGIPVGRSFNSEDSFDREVLGLKKDIFTVLVIGGNHGIGGIEKTVEVLASMKIPLQTLVVCGRNKILYKSLLHKYINKPYIKIFGYVKKIHQLMSISNLLITKAGAMTIAEAAHKKLPLIIFNPLPAQEEKNTEYLLKKEAAIYCKDTTELSDILRKILAKPSLLERYKERIGKIMPLGGADTIARYLIERL